MNNVQTLETLRAIGLTDTEAAIYLAGLATESISVQEIGRATGIKRPTIYHALSTLADKGLVADRKRSDKTHYRMCAPDHLLEWVRAKKEELSKKEAEVAGLIPALTALQSPVLSDAVSAVHYEGVEGVKTAFDVALYCKSKKWDVLAPYKNFLRDYDEAYAAYYLKARRYHGIISRTLWEPGMRGRKLTPDEVKERNPRMMPDSMQGKFESMMILFDDKVALISPLKDASAVVVSSKEMHALLTGMFDGIWNVSEPYA